jgi:acrylyl-CoA reductase (NADPH)
VIDRAELAAPGKPLSSTRWIAAIDTVGSHTLANVLSMTGERGAVVATGLAQGMDLPGSVAPFILRGIALFGVESARVPQPERSAAWNRIARDMTPDALALITADTIGLDKVVETSELLLSGKIRGRVIVDMSV